MVKKPKPTVLWLMIGILIVSLIFGYFSVSKQSPLSGSIPVYFLAAVVVIITAIFYFYFGRSGQKDFTSALTKLGFQIDSPNNNDAQSVASRSRYILANSSKNSLTQLGEGSAGELSDVSCMLQGHTAEMKYYLLNKNYGPTAGFTFSTIEMNLNKQLVDFLIIPWWIILGFKNRYGSWGDFKVINDKAYGLRLLSVYSTPETADAVKSVTDKLFTNNELIKQVLGNKIVVEVFNGTMLHLYIRSSSVSIYATDIEALINCSKQVNEILNK